MISLGTDWWAKQHAASAVVEAKTQRWKEFSGGMAQDFWLVPKRNLTHTVYSGGGELLSSIGVIVGWWKEYFKDVLNPVP